MSVENAGTSVKAVRSGMVVSIPSWTMSAVVTIQSDTSMKSGILMMLARSLRR